MTPALAQRLAAYATLRDQGASSRTAGQRLGVRPRTQVTYERWYRQQRGLPSPRAPRACGECWCCGRDAELIGYSLRRADAAGLCNRCYRRWQHHGFTGPGPGPEFTPAATRARDREATITSLPAGLAAAELGVSARTVVRWRSTLREAS